LIVLAYRFLWQTAGLRYSPYELFAIALYLGAAVMTRVVMRRVGVSPWVATVVASIVLFTGAGVEINFFTSVLILGMVQLLCADHDGPIDRRDYLGLLAGFAALMCSGLAVTTTTAVGLAVLLRRGWRVALFHTLPLAGAYLFWTRFSPSGEGEVNNAGGVGEVVRFVVIGLRTAFDRLGQLPGVSILAIAVLVAGSLCVVAKFGVVKTERLYAVPIGMFGAAVMFLLLTGLVRAGVNSHDGVKTEGPRLAADGRYAYVVITLLAPILAVAVDALVRRWRRLAPAFVAVVVVCTPAYLLQFRADARSFARTATDRQWVLAVPHLSVVTQLSRDLPVYVLPRLGYLGGTVRLGWLLDAAASGRLPHPDQLSAQDNATLSLRLALAPRSAVAPSTDAQSAQCSRIDTPTVDVLKKGDVLTVSGSDVLAVYESPSARSLPQRLQPGAFIARAHLPLQLSADSSARTVPTVCLWNPASNSSR
jgi:hypothetical protein